MASVGAGLAETVLARPAGSVRTAAGRGAARVAVRLHAGP
jgi:hypothetical protein